MVQRRHDLTLMLVGIAVIVLIVLNSLIYFVRIDLSADGANTISPVTKKLFDKIDEPLKLTYYISGKFLKAEPILQHVSDLLIEYARLSGGKVQVQIVDPDGKEQELGLENFGIQPLQLQISDNNQESIALVYAGVKIDYINSYKVLPKVVDASTVEYDVTSTITTMLNKKSKVLGLLIGEADQDVLHTYDFLKQQLADQGEVRSLTAGEPIPNDVDVLFVFKDRDLKVIDAFHVDQFLMSGKGVMVGLDTFSPQLGQESGATHLQKGAIRNLLEMYGVVYQDGWVLDNQNKPIIINQQVGQVQEPQLVRYPAWLSLSNQFMSTDNPVTARSPGLDLFWASPVSLKDGIEGEVLLHSSDRSYLETKLSSWNPQQLAMMYQTTTEKMGANSLAVLRKGQITSGFKGEDLKTILPGVTIDKQLDSVAQGRLIAVGDSEFASDLIHLQSVNSDENMVFVKNAFDWLGNSPELLELRTREAQDTKLDAITDANARTAVADVAWAVNVALVPAVLIAVGVIRFVRRKQAIKAEAE